jgi:hypothetical protein
MRCIALIYSNEKDDIPYGAPEWEQLMVDYRAFSAEAQRRGAMIAGDPLQSVETATTLRLRGGKVVPSDGPFAETKEQLGGYYILDCPTLDEAVELAALIPTAKRGSVEVRPMFGHDSRFIDRPGNRRYAALIYGEEKHFLPDGDPQLAAGMAAHQSLTEDTVASGEYITGDQLHPVAAAKTIRVRDGKTVVSDGPFAETKEQLGGFYLFNCTDLDRALALAARIPVGEHGCTEVRPILDV